MPELPSNAWIEKDADKLAARGQLPLGRSRRGDGPSSHDREMLTDILRAEAARRQQNDPSSDANARSEIPGTVEFFMKYGPSYTDDQNIPGRSMSEGGRLPRPGGVQIDMMNNLPGSKQDFDEYTPITEQDT